MSNVIVTPIDARRLKDVEVGDVVFLEGTLITCRDAAHKRLLYRKVPLPLSLEGLAIFHAGPIVAKKDGEWRVVSIGPTTSMRMERCEYDFIRRTGVKMIIGKGGMGSRTAKACKEFQTIHAIFPGGCAVMCANSVEKVEGVEWLDLGEPEALWILRVKHFGPLIISVDNRGNNLFERRRKAVNLEKKYALRNLAGELMKIGIY